MAGQNVPSEVGQTAKKLKLMMSSPTFLEGVRKAIRPLLDVEHSARIETFGFTDLEGDSRICFRVRFKKKYRFDMLLDSEVLEATSIKLPKECFSDTVEEG